MIKGDETRERIMEASRDLFHKRGYYNTSINDLIQSTGVKKGNLYFHIQSKEKLIVEVLKEDLETYEKQIHEGLENNNSIGSIERILRIIDAITAYHINDDLSKGCIFGNMALEIGDDGSEISLFVKDVFEGWVSFFEKLLLRAEGDGEIKLKESPAALARMILASIEGGVMLSKISGNAEGLTDCTILLKKIIEERRVV